MCYGHVQLLPNHIVGKWLCVERESRDLIWQHAMVRPNTICGVDSDESRFMPDSSKKHHVLANRARWQFATVDLVTETVTLDFSFHLTTSHSKNAVLKTLMQMASELANQITVLLATCVRTQSKDYSNAPQGSVLTDCALSPMPAP